MITPLNHWRYSATSVVASKTSRSASRFAEEVIVEPSRFLVEINSSASFSAFEIKSEASDSAASIYFRPRDSAWESVAFAFASAASKALRALR